MKFVSGGLTVLVLSALVGCGGAGDAGAPQAAADGAPQLQCPEGTELVSDSIARSAHCQTPDGVKHGPHVEWHPNGQLSLERSFHEGDVSGLARAYHADGALKAEMEWVSPGRVELTEHFAGDTLFEGAYDLGRPVGEWVFHTHGGGSVELVATYELVDDLTSRICGPVQCFGPDGSPVPCDRTGWMDRLDPERCTLTDAGAECACPAGD